MVNAKLYDGRLAVDIAGLKMQTPVTTASGTFGFGLEFTDFCCRAKATKASALLKLRPAC